MRLRGEKLMSLLTILCLPDGRQPLRPWWRACAWTVALCSHVPYHFPVCHPIWLHPHRSPVASRIQRGPQQVALEEWQALLAWPGPKGSSRRPEGLKMLIQYHKPYYYLTTTHLEHEQTY